MSTAERRPQWLKSLALAGRYWEPRRLPYNLVIITVGIIWLVATWPHFRDALTWSLLGPLAVLWLLGNVCYCAAYLVEVPMQRFVLASAWDQRRHWLWLAGMLVAVLAENYWIADEIYPFVR